jgi:SAM-dependent methyltransferase
MATSKPDAAFIEATYEELAQAGESGLCCSPLSLYSPEEIATLPPDVLRLSSGCGHPVDDADIEPGMTVLDIGSGAGADCMLAARRTGPTGSVIGIDPSESMRARARRHRDELGMHWIDYRKGTADALPIADGTVDLVISNCVLSLSSDPVTTWAEIGRVLKPGGSVVVSDIIGGAAWADIVGKARCETGLEWPDYRAILHASGFTGIRALHVRQATFRDGAAASSVTFLARHAMPDGHAAIDVLHDSSHRDMADRIVRELGELARQRELPLRIRRLATDDPLNRDTAELISGLGRAPLPLGVAVDTGLVCADDANPATIALETMKSLVSRS